MNTNGTINVCVKDEAELGRDYIITLEVPKELGDIAGIRVLLNQEGEKPSIDKQMKKVEEDNDTNRYCTNVQFKKLGNYYFFFLLNIDGIQKAIKIDRRTNQPIILEPEEESPYWRVLVVQPDFEIPDWATDKIAYQLWVDRFNHSDEYNNPKMEKRNYRNWGDIPAWGKNENGDFHNNDFFCGNLKGIEEKLDYFKELSVGILYLSPINESLYRHDRYASTNHMEIDPDAGTFKELKELHDKANQLGIHIILDVAFNHCSSDNPIFQEALNNPDSPYRNWFYFDENGNYSYWYGMFKDMPNFNQNCKEVQDYVYGENGVVAKYSPYVDGFRLDLAETLQPFFLEGIRNRANSFGRHLILGEFWDKAPIEVLGEGIDCPTNYPLTNALYRFVLNGNDQGLKWEIRDLLENYPKNTVDTMFNSLDTHDIMRAITIFSQKFNRNEPDRVWDIDKEKSLWHISINGHGVFLTEVFRKFELENDRLTPKEYADAKAKLKVAVMLQYFLPGIPCIYYGTEVGVTGFKDPFNRKCYPWDNQDKELLQFYRDIGKYRSFYTGRNSSFKVLYSDSSVFAFERRNDTNSVFVAVNRGDAERQIDIPEDFEASAAKDANVYLLNANIGAKSVLPNGGMIILK